MDTNDDEKLTDSYCDIEDEFSDNPLVSNALLKLYDMSDAFHGCNLDKQGILYSSEFAVLFCLDMTKRTEAAEMPESSSVAVGKYNIIFTNVRSNENFAAFLIKEHIENTLKEKLPSVEFGINDRGVNIADIWEFYNEEGFHGLFVVKHDGALKSVERVLSTKETVKLNDNDGRQSSEVIGIIQAYLEKTRKDYFFSSSSGLPYLNSAIAGMIDHILEKLDSTSFQDQLDRLKSLLTARQTLLNANNALESYKNHLDHYETIFSSLYDKDFEEYLFGLKDTELETEELDFEEFFAAILVAIRYYQYKYLACKTFDTNTKLSKLQKFFESRIPPSPEISDVLALLKEAESGSKNLSEIKILYSCIKEIFDKALKIFSMDSIDNSDEEMLSSDSDNSS